MVVRMKLLVAAALLFTSCATTTPPLSFAPLIQTPPFDKAFWAIHVEEDDGRVLYSLNADKLVMPASNRKLFASATIASCLGADAQLHTEIFRDGEDLVIRGDGDPSLGSWRYERDADFDRLAELLRARGIIRVREVVVDVSAFDRVTIPGGWKNGNLGSDYAAPVDAITWGESELPVDRATPDPALHAGNTLRGALERHGIAVSGVRVNTEPRAWGEKVADLPSPFVAQLLQTVLKNSHNLYAEMLLKRSAAGTYDSAFARERVFLTTEVGLDGSAFRFVDGSGLAPDDLMTARSAMKVVRWMNEPSRRALWWPTLATPNQDGTLRRRLVTLEDRLRGKTGTINGVAALSGIIAMPNGRFRYFSIVVNHHTGEGSDAVKIIDAIVERIAG
jgi:D-alanyl-D-alanine carboxypeptidase/D-alanyl-D-alanine-endopeptidase (penicillin-binding protein 4)